MNLEERFLNQAAAEKLPEGIVEVLPPIRDPEQFSKTATNREGGVGFATGAAQSAVSSGAKTAPTNLTPFSQAATTGQKPLTPDEINKLINDPALRFSAVSDRIKETFNNEPQSELIPLDRTMRQELAYSMQQLLVDKFGVDNYRAGRLSESVFGGDRSGAPLGLGLIDVTPFVIPLAFQESGISAGKSFDQIDSGNLGQAALEYGVGMLQGAEAIPAVGMAVKGLKAGAKSLAPNIADVMESGLRKTGMITDIVPDGKSVMQQAPKSDIGFYSAVENAAVNVQRKSGTGQSFLNDIMKGENVKAEEIKWIGLDDFLKSKKNVTKQEVQDYITNNKVDVQEVQLGGAQQYDAKRLDQLEFEYKSLKKHPIDDPSFGEEKYNELIKLMNIRDQSTTQSLYAAAEEATRRGQIAQKQGKKNRAEAYFKESEFLNTRAEKLDLEGQGMSNPTKFGQYTLAGGENYREILLTMPDKTPTVFTVQADSLTKEFNTMDEATAYKNTLMQQYPNSSPNIIQNKSLAPNDVNYKSTHFPDQKNILAHLRVNDRVDADGKKMLLIEEVQSDWHQAGRDKGYKTKQSLENWYNQNKLENDPPFADLNSDQIKTIERNRNAGMGKDDGVPDAPFKDTWYQLALKRALQYASENGYERVGLTTGKQQADRFDLSKQIDTLYPSKELDGTYTIDATKKSDGEVISVAKNIKESELSNYVGKDIANKIIKEKLDLGEDFEMSGVDLKIGGEGMKKYYDEIYPKFLEKYGKKWNAKMGETGITTGRANVNGVPSMYPDKETVRYIDITPEMKAGVKKGQPLFAAAPIGAATGAATMQDEGKK